MLVLGLPLVFLSVSSLCSLFQVYAGAVMLSFQGG